MIVSLAETIIMFCHRFYKIYYKLKQFNVIVVSNSIILESPCPIHWLL